MLEEKKKREKKGREGGKKKGREGERERERELIRSPYSCFGIDHIRSWVNTYLDRNIFKYLGINLKKNMNDLYNENYTTLKK
jgi:hypothetical protein